MKSYVTNLYPKPTPGATDQRLLVDATTGGVQLTSTSMSNATDTVVLDIQTADVMVTFDGSAPTSSNGHFLANGTSYTWSKAAAIAAKFIRQASTNASIHASEFTT